MKPDDLRKHAKHRTQLHRSHKTQRILGKDHDLVGLAGESAFASEFKVAIDLIDRPGGDEGMDFQLRTDQGDFIVDTKAGRQKHCMYIEAAKLVRETIYVMAIYDDFDESAVTVGWCFGHEAIELSPPPRDTGHGVINYVVQKRDLHHMNVLLGMCDLPLRDETTWVVLQTMDGDYVVDVVGTGWETVKLHFTLPFTFDLQKAKVFDRDQIFPRNAEFAIGTDFIRGFAGGKALQVKFSQGTSGHRTLLDAITQTEGDRQNENRTDARTVGEPD